MIKHFLDLNKIEESDLHNLLDLAANLKQEKIIRSNLANKNFAMIFEKSSTRTRVSFEVAINQLGGNSIMMNKNDMQLSKGEPISDTAKVLSRYVDGVIIRTNSHSTVTEFAKYSDIPIINALSDFSHPCQIIASLLTIKEKLGTISNKKLVWFGEQNNVLNSYIHAAKAFNYELVISSPKSMNFSSVEIEQAQKLGAKILVISNPHEAAKNADVIISDTWFSMGDKSADNEKEKQRKISELQNYQVNSKIMSLANDGAIFTHCLPAYRGYEVTPDVIDSNSSVVFDEAENRLHAQKAILIWIFQNSKNN